MSGILKQRGSTFLAGLLGLEPQAPREPLTLVAEDNAGSKARPTVFCRVESRGVRMTPSLGRNVKPEALYDEILAGFGFRDPYAAIEDEGG